MSADRLIPSFADLRSGFASNADVGDVDPDILLITDYLANELLDEDRAAVEERLIADGDFFDRMSPLIAMSDAARRAWRAEEHEREERERAARNGPRYGRVGVGRNARFLLQAAAAVFAMVAMPVTLALITPTAARRGVEALEVSEHRAPTQSFWRPETVQLSDSAADDGSRIVDAGGGVMVVAAAGARVTVDELRLPGAEPRIAIDGDARIDVPAGSRARILTADASLDVRTGSYLVHSPPTGRAGDRAFEIHQLTNAVTSAITGPGSPGIAADPRNQPASHGGRP